MQPGARRVSRRHLLKLCLAGALGVAVPVSAVRLAGAQTELGQGRSVSRTTGGARAALPSICQGCSARCCILGFAEDGIVQKVEGNPSDPNSRGTLCARGYAAVNLTYNPERLTQPLRKRGARRGGGWEVVSWDDALGELSERIRHRSRPEALVVESGTLSQRGVVSRFAAACGTPNFQLDELLYQGNALAADILTAGSSLCQADVGSSKFILNFGANPYESHPMFVAFVSRLVDARVNGARLVTLDPRLSNTAGRSDVWLPLRPGSDRAVALSLAHVIVKRGLLDRQFVSEHTGLATDSLAQTLAPYDPASVGPAAGIAAADLEALAVEFATTSPACAIAGGGVTKRAGGVGAARAVALLNALTGNLGTRGGIVEAPVYPLTDLQPAPPGVGYSVWPDVAPPAGRPFDLLGELAAGRQRAEVLLLHKANPAYDYPNNTAIAGLLADSDRLPFVACFDCYLTESAALADLVLPATTWLEAWDLDSVPALDRVPYVLLGQPVGRQAEGVVDAPVLYSELAKRVNGQTGRYMAFESGEQYAMRLAEQLPGLKDERARQELRARGVWRDPAGERPFRFAPNGGARTPSAKFDFGGVVETAPPPVKLGDGEFHLLVQQTSIHHRGETGASKWLDEISHDNPLWLNATVGRERGLHEGDRVRVTSATGTLETRVRLGNGLRPDVVAMADGVGHTAVSRGARAVRFASSDPDTNLLWWGEHGSGHATGALLNGGHDPAGGGFAWFDATVKVERLDQKGG